MDDNNHTTDCKNKIKGLSNSQLDLLKTDKNEREKFRKLLGEDTNPNWVVARIAEELYERGLISEKELDYLMQ